MEGQLGLSELIKSILGSEKQLLMGEKTTFDFAMQIDELEEVLDLGDVNVLFWINDHIDEKNRGTYLEEIQEEYLDACQSAEEGRIEDIDRHFREGMHYTYCYIKKLPINDETREKAIKFFMSEKTRFKLGRLIVAYTIGRYIETMLEEGTKTVENTESDS